MQAISWHCQTFDKYCYYRFIIISTTEHIYQFGKSNAEEMGRCATSIIKQFCKEPCGVIDTYLLPPCQTAEEYKCTDKAFADNITDYIDCFYIKKGLTFNPEVNVHTDGTASLDSKNAMISVALRTLKKETKEEIHLLTTPDLIGSIGGSLGMFFGFSIAPNLEIAIERLFN